MSNGSCLKGYQRTEQMLSSLLEGLTKEQLCGILQTLSKESLRKLTFSAEVELRERELSKKSVDTICALCYDYRNA
jgi:hypothetical protein